MKYVTKEEFYKYVNGYPGRLTADVTGIIDPPLISYNDFSLGVWPQSVVAFTYMYDDKPDGFFYLPEEERKYCIEAHIGDFR